MAFAERNWLGYVVAGLLAIIILFWFIPHHKKSSGNNQQADIALRLKPGENYDQFYVDKLRVIKRENGNIFLFISADKVYKRKRISKLFVYQNLKEICISGARIDIYAYHGASAKETPTAAIPIDEIGKSIISIAPPSTPVEEYVAGNADSKLDLLSRLLLHKVTLNMYSTPGRKISIEAERATVNPDLLYIVFEGSIKIVDSSGNVMSTEKAVWSKQNRGLYVPGLYISRHIPYKGKAFFIMNKEKGLLKDAKVPDMDFADPLEQMENELYAHISKDLQGYAKFMFDTYQNY